jgi:hypothetical protein
MTLLAPLGLLALLALPVIVILHMLRERRRRVVVPSLLLWQLLPRRQEAQQRRRLPLTLLLLLHLLAAALLALALARPQWPLALFGSQRSLAVVVDTSTSMAAPAGAGSRLDAARARARELIAAAGPSGSVTLIAAGTEARVVDAGGPEDAARLAAALDALTAAGTGSAIPAALTLAEAALQGRPDPQIVVLTDAALPALAAQLDGRVFAVPVEWQSVGRPAANRAILTLAARPRPGAGPVQVYARVANYDAAPFQGALRLYGDDAILDTRPVSMDANGEAELTWAVPRGVALLRAELDGADGLPIDDRFTISLAQARPVAVLLASPAPAALERALRAVPGLTVSTVDPRAYAGSDADLTIFDGFLPDAWPAGGALAINPPAGSPLLEVAGRAREAAPDAVVQALPGGLLDGVSIGSVAFGPVRAVTPPEGFVTLLRRGEQPLILRGRAGSSEVAVWAFDLAQGNLTTRLAFPLLVARAVRDLAPPPLPPSALLGETVAVRVDPRADRVELGAPDGAVRVVEAQPGRPVELALDEAGVYSLAERAGDRVLFEGRLGVNAGAPVESDLTPRELPASPPATAAQDGRGDGQQPLWPWLAAGALAVMLGEWLYVNGRRRAPAEG